MGYPVRTGVYVIQSISHPERVYVGSALRITERWGNHKRELKKDKHHSSKLQRHYNKYGLDDLVFDVLEEGDYINKTHLLAREQGWFDHFATKETKIPYFNINPFADSCAGVKRSPESVEKRASKQRGQKRKTPVWNKGIDNCYSEESNQSRSETLKAFYQTEEGKAVAKAHSEKTKGKKKHPGFGLLVSNATKGEKHHNFGKKLPKETTDKMSLSRIGNKNAKGFKHTDETKKKQSEMRKKENLSPETLEKMKNSQIGRKHSEETKKKIGEGNKGKTVSEESREKMRQAALRRYNKDKDLLNG